MTRPQFSIITPTFNSGPKLERTIRSVLSQDQSLCECIIMDGGSSDGTGELLERHAGRITCVSRPDKGVYDAMNQGVGLSSGRYLYFLGAGDALRPGILRTLAPLLPDLADVFAYGSISETGRRPFNGRYGRWKLSRVNICHQAVFCGRRVFDRLGPFDLKYPVLADYAFNDFEGGGMSATRRDGPFLEDRLALFKAHLGFGPWAVNKLISLIPAGLKESRYQWYRRLLKRPAR